jgi:quercetin dioxygenase-like cupin family protein
MFEHRFVVPVSLAAIAVAFALGGVGADGRAEAKGGGKAVLTPAGDIQWQDVPGFPGVKMAVVEGDVAKGAHHAFLKFAAGFAAPIHHHTARHFVTVVAGTLILTVEGKETKLPPGSYFAFSGGKLHATKCSAGADCVLFLDTRGKWDVIAEKSAKAP